MYENTGRALPEGALDSESATSRAKIELAIWSTRSTKPICKISLGTIKRCEKLRRNLKQHRGVPLSAVEAQNTILENKVKRLIEKFENHKHKESFIQDLSQTQNINQFSKEWQDLIADLNNTEIFELCENSSKPQCLDCNLYWAIGIIYCNCGRSMKLTRSPTDSDQNNRDVTSTPGNVIRKNSSCGVKHGPCERQQMHYQARHMLKKAQQEKHGRHPTIRSRLYAEEEHKKSLSATRWKEHHTMLYDRIAVEKHIYTATRS